jgi:acetate kinase
LGIRLDPVANDVNARDVSAPDAACRVLVVPTDEEHVIAQATRELAPRPSR